MCMMISSVALQKKKSFFYLQKKCTPFVAQGRPWNKLDTIVKLWNRRQGKRGGFFYFEKNPEDNAENQGNKARNESRVSGLYHLSSSARDIIIIHLVLCAHVMRICLFDFVFFSEIVVCSAFVCMYVCTQLVFCSKVCLCRACTGIEFGSHCLSLFVVSPAPSTQKENICVSDV